MIGTDKAYSSLLGALTADAATLRLHWIYDVDLITQIIDQNSGQVAFVPSHLEGIPDYHKTRKKGMQTQYGECLLLALQSMSKTNGTFDVRDYQNTFAKHFGPDGAYKGYIDRPTKGTLENIQNARRSPSGIDDDQLPALSRLPALVATRQPNIDEAIEITNVNKDASAYGRVFAKLLNKVINGDDLNAALTSSAEEAPDTIKQPLIDALNTSETDSIAYGEITGRACHLPMAAPLMFHILKHTTSYTDAVETNIKTGGDNAGRSIMIGAIRGAVYGERAIPTNWIKQAEKANPIRSICEHFCLKKLQPSTEMPLKAPPSLY